MKKKIEKTFYGIVGLGKFGMALVEELAKSGRDVLVVDWNEEKIREARELTENALVADALNKKALEETGIGDCDIAVVCMGHQLENSLLATLNLLSMGVPRVIAKSSGPAHSEILKRLGAEVIEPERDMAVRLATRLEALNLLDYIELSDNIIISKLLVPKKCLGKTLRESGLRANFHINVIAVEHDGTVEERLSPDYTFEKGDVLVVSTSKQGILDFSAWAGSEK